MPRHTRSANSPGAAFIGSSPTRGSRSGEFRVVHNRDAGESRHLPASPAVFLSLPSSIQEGSRTVGNVNPLTIFGAAALLLALAPQSAAVALPQSGSTGVTRATYGATPNTGLGNVVVVMPGSAIAGSDGLDAVVRHGQTYRAEFLVWVAPNAGSATLALHADGAGLSHCTNPRLRPGTTSAVMCLVRTDTDAGERNVSTDVVVQTSNLGMFSRTFRHALTG